MKIVFWNCGSTGNLGDDLCHLGAVERCRQIYGEFLIRKIFRLNEKNIEEVNAADLLVIGGGRMLDRSDILQSLFAMGLTTRCFFVGISIGALSDIHDYADRLRSKQFIFIVRNQKSANLLANYGIASTVEEDVSSLVNIDFEPRSEKYSAALNLKNTHRDGGFEREIQKYLPKDVSLISFNTTPRHRVTMDGEMCWVSDSNDTELLDKIAEGREVLCYRGGYDKPEEFAAQIGRFHFMVVDRFHAAVLARRAGVEFLAINSCEKIERAMSEWGMKDRLIQNDAKSIGGAFARVVA